MRAVLFVSICLSLKAFAQDDDPTLKYSIVLGKGLQMAFDPIDRKHNFNTEIDAKLSNGDLQFYRGHYKRSIDYYHQIIKILLVQEDNGPIDVFKISNLRDKRYTKSEKLLRQFGKKVVPKSSYDELTSALNNLGIYHHHIGDYVTAEKLFLKALQLRGEVFGKTSLEYVSTLHNLAVLRKDQGRYDAAADMLAYVTRFFEKKNGNSSLPYLVASSNQAMLLGAMGQVPEAIAALEALGYSSDFFPNHSLDYARILANKGLLQLELDELEKAEQLLKEAIEIYELKGAQKHPDYWYLQLELARVNLQNNNTAFLNERIENYLIELEKDFGQSSVAYLTALELKGDFLMKLKDFNQASQVYQIVVNERESSLGVLHKDYLSVSTKLAESQWKNGQSVLAKQLLSETMKRYLKVVEEYFYNMTENEKTRFWSALNPDLNSYYAFVSEKYSEFPDLLREAYDLRLKTKGLLLNNSNQIRRSLQSSLDEDLKKKYQEWISIKETLANYYGFSQDDLKVLGIDTKDLEKEAAQLEKEINRTVSQRSSINESASLSDIRAKLKENEVAIEIIRISGKEDSKYVALIASRGIIKFVSIGEANEIDRKITPYYHNVIRTKTKETLTYRKFWEPLASQISGYSKAYISLDGAYNLINLNALKVDDNYLIDQLDIEVVPNTSTIAKKSEQNSNTLATLIGNPNFNGEAVQLPGTKEEIEAIAAILKDEVTILLNEEANENALKQIKKPRVLHIATHGFFQKDSKSKNGQRSLTVDNPLLRSGLLLTKPASGEKKRTDGVFTSYDAMNLNLQNTDLVVLSACETGKGEVVNGEGVYGLSRAFTIAGARNLIMSLWKVDDQATKDLMISLYRNWESGLQLKDSFRKAQLEMKEKYQDPYYWAAFVLITNEPN